MLNTPCNAYPEYIYFCCVKIFLHEKAPHFLTYFNFTTFRREVQGNTELLRFTSLIK